MDQAHSNGLHLILSQKGIDTIKGDMSITCLFALVVPYLNSSMNLVGKGRNKKTIQQIRFKVSICRERISIDSMECYQSQACDH